MKLCCVLLLWSCSLAVVLADEYLIGSAITDITGPVARVNFMGMAHIPQVGRGLRQRAFSRAFAFADVQDSQPLMFISADLAFIPGGIREAVVQKLPAKFGGTSPYTYENLMISATHTHSCPGGYSTETLYDITSFGFVKQNFDIIVNGLVESIYEAHMNRKQGRLRIGEGELLNTNANRSPFSYTFNKDANDYKYNVDKGMTVLSLEVDNSPTSLIAWMAVHGTSLNNTNKLVAGDNKGYASLFVERQFSEAGIMPGKGSFVAAFAQSNEGDVSPNTEGASCPDGSPCNPAHSTCDGSVEFCIAPGPGKNMYESNSIIGNNQVNEALSLLKTLNTTLEGSVSFRHTFLNFGNISVAAQFTSTGKSERTCLAALGASFAAGTTDGPGAPPFIQGMNYTPTEGPVYDLMQLTHLLSEPTQEQLDCQAPKPVFLNVGDISWPGHSSWAASVIPLQMFKVGQLYLIGVPVEMTTMSGRRLRNQIRATLIAAGADAKNLHVVIAGLSNEYTHYCATYEEYNIQRYEAASTLYGPHTLAAYLQEFSTIANSLFKNTQLPAGLSPPYYNFTRKLFPEWTGDTHPLLKPFGTVLEDVASSYNAGQTASVKFVGAMPNNNYKTGETYLEVQMKNSQGQWMAVAWDSDWETIFHWDRPSLLTHNSEVSIDWEIPVGTPSGTYRIVYYGDSLDKSSQKTTPFTGTSSSFQVN